MASETRSARRRNDHRSGHDEGLDQSFGDRGPVNGVGRRHDDQTRPASHAPSREPGDQLAQIGQRAVRAVPDVDLIEMKPRRQLVDRDNRCGIRRAGNERWKPVDVDVEDMVVTLLVGNECFDARHRSGVEPFQDSGVRRADAAFRPRLDGHVAQRHPVVDGELVDDVSRELERAVRSPGRPCLPEDGEDEVLACRPRARLPRKLDPNRLRHAHPHLAEREGRGDIGRPEAQPECAERPVGTRMRVAAGDQGSGRDEPELG